MPSILITTSRRPSPRTRAFCQRFKNGLDALYINRGKMNMQEVFLKACEEGAHVVAIVLELKGNPSRITFYDVSGEELAYILMNVAIPRRREFNIDRKRVTAKVEVEELLPLTYLLFLTPHDSPMSNYWHIKKGHGKYMAIMELIDEEGKSTGLKLFILDFEVVKHGT